MILLMSRRLRMKRFVALCILFGCALTISEARRTVAAANGAYPGKLTAQSPEDILPAGAIVIMTPIDQYAWRVWPGGKIEYSFDSSRTWELQKSGVTTDLTGGSAPSAKICWVIGKTGTILLTTDRGKHWKKITSPIKEDIGGIYARDGKRASIWTASHKQSFETNDGGVTWAPNVSE